MLAPIRSPKKISRELLVLLFSAGGGILAIIFSTFLSPGSRVHSEQPELIPPQSLRYFTFGYSEILGDVFWLRTIQDFDFCENRKADEPNSSVMCERGWVYHMIDAVTELAPRFRQPYLSGGLMLSIVVNDVSGASEIFNKAVEAFPDDGQILYNSAYQALVEEHDNTKASRLLVQAGKHGAPPWVFALAARLQQKAGQLEFAKSILTEAIELNPTGPGAERIQLRLDEVEKELAKQPRSP